LAKPWKRVGRIGCPNDIDPSDPRAQFGAGLWSSDGQGAGGLSALMIATVTVFFHWRALITFSMSFKKIDRSIPIVPETEQIANRGIFRLKTRRRISDGSRGRCFDACWENLRREFKALPRLQQSSE
jgi:hypothetical protein